MSISPLRTQQPGSLTNPVNAPHFSDIKASIELAVRQKAPQIPGTVQVNPQAVMPGSAPQGGRGPGSVLNAYA